jgi:hypothetical protein
MNTEAGVRVIAWDPDAAATAVAAKVATTVAAKVATTIKMLPVRRRMPIGPRQRPGRSRRFRIAPEAAEGGPFRTLV